MNFRSDAHPPCQGAVPSVGRADWPGPGCMHGLPPRARAFPRLKPYTLLLITIAERDAEHLDTFSRGVQGDGEDVVEEGTKVASKRPSEDQGCMCCGDGG